jgi:hypothetical protein
VKLPEALADVLGKMIVACNGWMKDDRAHEAEIFCVIRWRGCEYKCPVVFPPEVVYVDKELEKDCRSFVEEAVENEGELEYRLSRIDRVVPAVERAVKRFWKEMIQPANCPEGLRPVPRVRRRKEST